MMVAPDVLHKLVQPFHPGVGTTSNLVFPATLIDEEWDQLDVEDMTRYLESHFTTIP